MRRLKQHLLRYISLGSSSYKIVKSIDELSYKIKFKTGITWTLINFTNVYIYIYIYKIKKKLHVLGLKKKILLIKKRNAMSTIFSE